MSEKKKKLEVEKKPFLKKIAKGLSKTPEPLKPVVVVKPVEPPKPPPPPPPPPLTDDLFIVADEGYLGENSNSFSEISRVRVSNSRKEIIAQWKGQKIHTGFGIGRQGAILDFIRRNESEIIERIFNAS